MTNTQKCIVDVLVVCDHTHFYMYYVYADKLDGFKIRKRHHSENDNDVEELSLKEYLQKMEMEYKDVGKPTKKRVRYCHSN